MSNPLFANSKSALVFAGITIFGTLMMVGPGGGILGQAKDRFGQTSEPVAEEPAPIVEQKKPEVAEPLDPDAGWGGTGEAVFGDYGSEAAPASEILPEEDSAEPSNSASPAFGQRQVRRVSALPQATGGPVKADSLGELVPRDGGGEAPRAEAVVTSRSISIEPQ
jgi:hypothetical protein